MIMRTVHFLRIVTVKLCQNIDQKCIIDTLSYEVSYGERLGAEIALYGSVLVHNLKLYYI